MTSIGILGAGRVGANLAGKLSAAGHHVALGRRSPTEQPAAVAEGTGPRVSFADQRTTARTADIVINATPGDSALDLLAGLRTELAGKILIDVSNATHDLGDITTARATEAMILVVPHVLRRHGFRPFAVSLAR
ncbi:NAD(P)-binding domain-containing protein [Streptomyces sp. NBC_00193]|uniref:NADPH-dependent F420 reductase n=1 Tax=Streptomyces sp. NBC_00193 TaxID=2975675 RepID=UPI00225B47BA|nr:NAD(P)-binding domain-containing protein [Streptomyces sp. NBC_00193]MCX5301038.1 NAD(P)-binding domain-containing protein [Streptomyces sp. NBC_00193]